MKILNIYRLSLILLFILAFGAGAATFLENFYDTQTARVLVYEALWYECVMAACAICLVISIVKTKMYKKFGAFLIHLAFILIFIGAALTRYFGEEGVMHLRVGESGNSMQSTKPYLRVQISNESFEYPLRLSLLGKNDFHFKKDINGKEFKIKIVGYKKDEKNAPATLSIEAGFANEKSKSAKLKGGAGYDLEPSILSFDGQEAKFYFSSRAINLPFSLRLDKFILERYAGLNSPSSYTSKVSIAGSEHEISLNHPLSIMGYKIFQSSYDADELGSAFEISFDPGKVPTYIGYFLLCLGFVGNLFSKKSRFFRLCNFIKGTQFAFLALLLLNATPNFASDEAINFKAHADKFAKILVQTDSRIAPAGSYTRAVISKISTKTTLFGLSSDELMLSFAISPQEWMDKKMVKITSKRVGELLGVSEKFASFNDVFNENGEYKLAKFVEAANEKSASKRDKFDSDVIKFDERLNVLYLALKGEILKFIPAKDGEAITWLGVNEAFSKDEISNEFKSVLGAYVENLSLCVKSGECAGADKSLEQISSYQRSTLGSLAPSEAKASIEVLYNQMEIFKFLIYFYMILALASLALGFYRLFFGRKFRFERALSLAFFTAFAVHALNLALRAYISGHAPWSDAYESLVYISLISVLAGVLFFKHQSFALGAASLFASVSLLVAHLNFINPQITNLVPVLKSFWLSVHVSVITASYGFLGFGFVLGLVGLILMALKNDKNEQKLSEQIRYLAATDELSLIIGLSLLTIGNFLGGVWANESWGRYWGWDSKESWSYITIIVYAMVLHLRFIPKLRGVFAFLTASVLSFASVLFTYFGVNFYLSGLHSYANGESFGISGLIYLILAALALLIALAYRGRDIKVV
ncbi:cytochrome c biogenesis protein [Campylobacter concisus]|uniref:Cytochrome c biogenesis protein CcsA n=1 Tax=Campylobacter concisus TaxID=199 RepID=A0A7S9X7T5_9BACT|nr:cytochrome c biogenesis protein CcsA [Campylobacter concisus]QPI07600.1 cytochrome c biogenesis protein CcsA [Campylobacter concisus]